MNDVNVNELGVGSETPKRPLKLDMGTLVLLVGIVAFIVVIGLQLTSQNETQPTAGNTAPDFTVTTFDGESFTLSEHRGNIVVVNFWGSWCGPCRYEAPDLQRIHERYADQGVVMIGVTYIDEPEDSLDFIDEFSLTYMNAPDPRSDVAGKYNIDGAPETFIIGRDGKVVENGTFIGAVNEQTITELLDGLLALDDSA